jgi:tetratricopeptide (TPR) repeat protein
MMIRKYFYPLFFIAFAALVTLILVFGKKEQVPQLKPREVAISPASEWLNTRAAIEGLRDKLRKNPGDQKASLQLALAYIQEGRITGDHGYYDPAALQLLNQVLEKEPDHFDALCGKATVYLSGHHFAEAIPIAQRAVQLNPYSAFAYGLLVDGYVETGNYPKAVEMAEKMIAARPDIRSYARISYLREIHGDYPGAIEAMDMAVKAGQPGLEQTAWTRVHLGQLYEEIGKLPEAEHQYRRTLVERPHYAYALAGLGRMEKLKKNYKEAVAYLKKAARAVQDPSFTEQLVEVYQLSGQPEKAAKANRTLIAQLTGGGHAGEDDPDNEIGHYADLELAYAYLKTNQPALALRHAETEYERRPQNIDVNEALAWVQYKRGAYPEAARHIALALRTGSRKPALLYRAGLIHMKNGQPEVGRELVEKSLSINPFLRLQSVWEEPAYLARN